MDEFQYLYEKFAPLWDDAQVSESKDRPAYLAHYTSISTMEMVVKNDEIWLSNPLFMNDFEELRFGVNMGAHEFRVHQGIRDACGTDARYEALRLAFEARLAAVSNEHAFDTYVMSFSAHCAEADRDGSLSMWRGYGANGNGAALVVDVSKLPYLGVSPFVLAKVFYGSGHERVQWIKEKLDLFATLLADGDAYPEASFPVAVGSLLERLVLFALFSKHDGFKEEREWRLVYIRDRDKNSVFVDMLSYAIGEQGVQPKMKFKTNMLERITNEPFSFRESLHSIILGPSISNELTVTSVIRMFASLNLLEVAGKVRASSTPYRAQ